MTRKVFVDQCFFKIGFIKFFHVFNSEEYITYALRYLGDRRAEEEFKNPQFLFDPFTKSNVHSIKEWRDVLDPLITPEIIQNNNSFSFLSLITEHPWICFGFFLVVLGLIYLFVRNPTDLSKDVVKQTVSSQQIVNIDKLERLTNCSETLLKVGGSVQIYTGVLAGYCCQLCQAVGSIVNFLSGDEHTNIEDLKTELDLCEKGIPSLVKIIKTRYNSQSVVKMYDIERFPGEGVVLGSSEEASSSDFDIRTHRVEYFKKKFEENLDE
jgi:uncharacterized membrane protein